MKLQNLAVNVIAALAVALPAVALTISPSLAAKNNYKITNYSHTAIFSLHMTESSVNNWGTDLLGYDLLHWGEAMSMRFNNPSPFVCLYDIRAIFANGRVVEDFRVNVCSSDGYMFYDR